MYQCPHIRRPEGSKCWVVLSPVRFHTDIMKVLRLVVVAVSIIALSGCAADVSRGGSPGSDVPPSSPVAPASGEVFAQATVLQVGSELPQLCLGPIAESYPPQCSGPEVVGWDWTSTDQSEEASGVIWGAYAVQGTWDGSRLTVTQPPIPLSLFDPMVDPDPYLDPSNAGRTSDDLLDEMMNSVANLSLPGFVGAWKMNGYLFVDVVHDVQPAQSILDMRYGPGVAVVRPALKPIG